MNIDDVDIQILNFLQADAKMPIKEMAEKLNLSSTPIYERIKKMEKAGIIVKYTAILDHQLLGKQLLVYMNITVKDHGQKARVKFVNSIRRMKEVMEFCHTSGSFDFLLKVRIADIKDYRDFLVNKIMPIENVNDIESHIVLEEIKSKVSVPLEP